MRRFESREARFSSRTLQQYVAFGLPEKLAIRAATASAPAELMIYDEIGFWGVTAEDVVTALASIGDGPLTVRLNSPGGDVWDGMAIYNALRARGNVTTQVDGIAASAASYIAMAGATVTMAETSMLMVHNSWTIALGNANDMREQAGIMDKIDGQMAAIYAAKTGKSVEDVRAMLDAETWLTGTEAKAQGFCDALINPVSGDDQDAEDVNAKARADRKATIRAAQEPAEPAPAPAAPETPAEPETAPEPAAEPEPAQPDAAAEARLRRAKARLRLADLA